MQGYELLINIEWDQKHVNFGHKNIKWYYLVYRYKNSNQNIKMTKKKMNTNTEYLWMPEQNIHT